MITRTRRRLAQLALLAFAASAAASLPAQVAKADDASDARQDLDAALRALTSRYAYRQESKLDWDRIRARYEKLATRVETRLDLLRLLERLADEAHDHHLHLSSNTQSSWRLVPSGLDAWVELDGSAYTIEDVRPDSGAFDSGLRAGAVLLEVGGRSIEDAVRQHLRFSQDKTSRRARAWAARRLLAGRHNEASTTLTVRDTSGVRRQIEFSHERKQRGRGRLVHEVRDGMHSIRICNSLGDEGLISDFDAALATVDAPLVLDLRDTPSGGNTRIARALMGRLIATEMPYQRHAIPGGGEIPRAWTELVAPRGKTPFTKPMVVLVGRWTGSMGEGLAIGLDAMRRATVVGTRMAGLRGATERFTMPRSGFGIYVPVETLSHIDGTAREAFRASVLVQPRQRTKDHDPWWAAARRVLARATTALDARKVLEKCLARYAGEASAQRFTFRGKEEIFGHLDRPWRTRPFLIEGSFDLDKDKIFLERTRRSAARSSRAIPTKSSTLWSPRTMRSVDERGKALSATSATHAKFLYSSCAFTPLLLLQHARRSLEHTHASRSAPDAPRAQIHGRVNARMRYEIEVDLTSGLVHEITWTRHFDTWGDQTSSFEYEGHALSQGRSYARSVSRHEFAVRTLALEVRPAAAALTESRAREEPKAALAAASETSKEIRVEAQSERLRFFHIVATNSRVAVVEFRDFLMVIDAPVATEHADRLLRKLRELGDVKPVRYFAFDHHHPHYIAGMRSYVAAGATVVCPEKMESYVRQLVAFPHTLRPDALQQRPRALKLETFRGSKRISDGEYELRIFEIGMASGHTVDYQLFYFPKEKLLFQGDGIWLRDGAPSKRTRAIYDAVRKLELDVVDCVQSWPIEGFGVETKISFAQLEKACKQD